MKFLEDEASSSLAAVVAHKQPGPTCASPASLLPAQHPSLPAQHPSLPAQHPSLPAHHPSLPAQHPSLPSHETRDKQHAALMEKYCGEMTEISLPQY